jgi:thiamine-phosphate pyrophosphorylase
MNLNTSYFENFYFFTSSLTEENKKSILKFKNLAIIYQKQKYSNNLIELNKIIKFCKKKSIKVYVEDDIKIAKKLNLDGVLISNKNKIIGLYANHNNKKKFKIIGKAHNQLEYFFKNKQNCKNILLSPIFKNKKYNDNKILNIVKFNLISKDWKSYVFALGGVNSNNFKKIGMTGCKGIGFISFINDLKIKKPVHFLK